MNGLAGYRRINISITNEEKRTMAAGMIVTKGEGVMTDRGLDNEHGRSRGRE